MAKQPFYTGIEDTRRRFRRSAQTTGDVLNYLSGQARGRVLDLPAGDGRTTKGLVDLGFEVLPADLFPHGYRLDAPACQQVDMSKPLPFEDGTFDYIVCQEGIEHIESPLAFTRECARVTKAGGQLILTTPNVLHVSARVAYLLAGHRTVRRGYINEQTTLWGREGDDLYHGHAWHWRYPLLRYIMRLSGYRVETLLRGNYSVSSFLLSIPLYPFLWIANRRAVRSALRRAKRYDADAEVTLRPILEEIRGHLLSPALLWNKTTLIVAVKE